MEITNWPISVRKGVIFLIGGWLGVYGFMAAFTFYFGEDGRLFSNRLILQTLILGVGLSFFVIRGKNWARIISLFGNLVPMLLAGAYLAFVHFFQTLRLNWVISFLALAVFVCFGLSIYYLVQPSSKTHFQLSSIQPDDNSGSSM